MDARPDNRPIIYPPQKWPDSSSLESKQCIASLPIVVVTVVAEQTAPASV
jgi:hypothetical protein